MAKIVEQIILKVTLQDGASKPMKGLDDTVKKTTKSTDGMSKGFDNFEKSLKQSFAKSTKSASNFSKALKLIAAVGIARALKNIALQGIDVALQFDTINNSLKVMLGSMTAVEGEMAFLTNLTNKLGLETLTAADAYSKLLASTKGSGISLKETRDLFEGVASASAAIGLSADDTEGALRAISQMASKGRISLEELTGQLGERIPGSLNIAAKAMGITNNQLIKMVENGELMAEDLLPKLAKALKDEFGAAAEEVAGNSAQANINRLKNEWNEMLNTIGSGLAKFIPLLTKVLQVTNDFAKATIEVGEGLTLWRDEFLGIDKDFSKGFTDAQLAQFKMNKERSEAAKQAIKDQKAFNDELAKMQGLKNLFDLARAESAMRFIREESGLTADQFSKVSGHIAKELSEGKKIGQILRDLKEFSNSDFGSNFLGKGVGEQGVMDAILDSLDDFDDMFKDDVLKNFDDLIKKGEQFKKTFNLAKEIGLSKSEFEKIKGLLDQARRAGLSPDQIKERVEELRREGVLGKGKEVKDPILGGGTTNISGQKEISAFLQGKKMDSLILKENEKQNDKLDTLIDVVREQGTITETL